LIGLGVKLAAGLLGAVLLSQFPEFAQQYRQRLGGAIDALAPIVAQFDAVSSTAGLTREDALSRLRANPDDLVVGQTEATADAIDRYERLAGQQRALQTASDVERLVVFAGGYDPELARRTYDDFRPAVPVTLEGVFHAGGGFVIGYAAAALCGGMVGYARRRRRPA